MPFQLYSANKKQKLPDFQENTKINDPKLYRPSKGLIDAVNVALALGQPLLLTGEPGTGKTRLADHVAYIFDLGKPLVFNAQTSSTAKDLFYKYDALGHFQYSQSGGNKALNQKEIEQKFIKYQALGKAIKEQSRYVVLIDEIDKAPRDLPNDILAALEDLEFTVIEIDETYKAPSKLRPIIIMTSNSEKNLPDAFLRRVTYYHIPFPDATTLLEILKSKIDGFSDLQLSPLIAHFEKTRKGKRMKLRKNPATAELIHWALLLQQLGLDTAKLGDVSSLSSSEKEQLSLSYSVLAKTKEDLVALKLSLAKLGG